MNILYAGYSDRGLKRERNEDALLMCSAGDCGLFLVADGIGGKENGELASGKIRDYYAAWWERFRQETSHAPLADILNDLKRGLNVLNGEITAEFGQGNTGSTVVILFLMQHTAAFLSAGDSRIYRQRGLKFEQMTRDDVWENLSSGPEKDGDDIRNGKLVGAIGIREEAEYSAATDAARNGDIYFLCSDGVYKYCSPFFLKSELFIGTRMKPLEEVSRRISAQVIKGGAGDNYSLIIVKAKD